MDNLVRLVYRPDLDSPSRMHKKVYQKLSRNRELYAQRIMKAPSEVNPVDSEGGVTLEFCFTGYYPRGKHFICATWPRHPQRVEFTFPKRIEVEKHFRGWTRVEDRGDPKVITVEYSRQADAASQYYMFLSQDPHQAHRPYFFSFLNSLFRDDEQDDAKVIAHHHPSVQMRWDETSSLVTKAMESDNPKVLNAAQKVVHYASGHALDELTKLLAEKESQE